jgi:predicted dehydrogenase
MKSIAIIGCGLIGKKRVLGFGREKIRYLYDAVPSTSERLGQEMELSGCVVQDLAIILGDPEVEIVVVATSHKYLAPLAVQALEAGKHVLVEKPGAMNLASWEKVIAASKASGRLVRVGFNHRYHPAMQKARAIIDSGVMGPLFLVRGRYGHGGRIGYDKEWRADASISGGGELMDQGVHLIDLCGWYLGKFKSIEGSLATYFWQMPVEDNAFIHLKSENGATAWLHATWTEWKNCFSLEIYGRDGKIDVSGLGGSYGMEKLTYHQMLPQMGPPQTTVFEYPEPDTSWKREADAFFEDIALGRQPSPGLEDTRETLRVVQTIYDSQPAQR